MEKILVAVGSKRPPKLKAAHDAMTAILPLLHPGLPFEIVSLSVPSGVRHTPLSRRDTMAGARQRAESLKRIAGERTEAWKYFIGLEGGLDVITENGARMVFLENWAYVADSAGRLGFGQSGAVLLPDSLAKSVVDDGLELADAMDAFTGGKNIRDAEGAWGILTRNLITREAAFRTAIINAFAPFLGGLPVTVPT